VKVNYLSVLGPVLSENDKKKKTTRLIINACRLFTHGLYVDDMYSVPKAKRYFLKRYFLCDLGSVTLLLWASDSLWLGYKMVSCLNILWCNRLGIHKIIGTTTFSLKR
jgi:hypothetical protein